MYVCMYACMHVNVFVVKLLLSVRRTRTAAVEGRCVDVPVYVCMYVCMYVCECMCVCMCRIKARCRCIDLPVYVCMYVCMHVSTY